MESLDVPIRRMMKCGDCIFFKPKDQRRCTKEGIVFIRQPTSESLGCNFWSPTDPAAWAKTVKRMKKQRAEHEEKLDV